MRGIRSTWFSGLGLAAIALTALRLGNLVQVQAQDDASKPEFYRTRVKPVLEANCLRCHGGLNHRGGLSMETRESMIKGGKDGTALVPGDPVKSLLVQLMRHEGPAEDPMNMPPKKPKLSDADIATVEQWVKAGAIMP